MDNAFVSISERIYVIKASSEPLSADVYLIRGDKYNWIFDVGNNDVSLKALDDLTDKKIVISHFHSDHLGNIKRLSLKENEELFVSPFSSKYVDEGTIVRNVLEFFDGVNIKIIPLSSSHAKGCLMLVVNDEYAFTGDATYPKPITDAPSVYNVQKLKETIECLEKSEANKLVLSHDHKFDRPKRAVIMQLKSVFNKRVQGEPCIVSN